MVIFALLSHCHVVEQPSFSENASKMGKKIYYYHERVLVFIINGNQIEFEYSSILKVSHCSPIILDLISDILSVKIFGCCNICLAYEIMKVAGDDFFTREEYLEDIMSYIKAFKPIF